MLSLNEYYGKMGAGMQPSGASLNIAYGQNAPTETDKLWVKTNEPENIEIGNKEIKSVLELTTTLPVGASRLASAAVGTKIYLLGGQSSLGRLDSIYIFDTETNTVSTSSVTLPYGTNYVGIASVGTKIYLFGGEDSTGSYTNTKRVTVYDAETDTITQLSTALPKRALGISATSVGSKIYLFGGYTSDNWTALNTINVFDTETNAISTLTVTLPQPRIGMASAAVGTKIYLFGGFNTNWNAQKDIYVFDTETNTVLTSSVTLPNAIGYPTRVAIDQTIYLFSEGESIYAFNTKTNTVETLAVTFPYNMSEKTAANVGKKIYLFGGNRTNKIFSFFDSFELNEATMFIKENIEKNRFNLLSSPTEVLIGVEEVFIGNSSGVSEKAEAYLYDGTEWKQI